DDRTPAFDNSEWEVTEDCAYLGTIVEPNSDTKMMVCTKTLDSGVMILLSQAVEPINQSIRQANILLIACALVSLGISAVFVFKLSKRFTKPIREIQNTVGSLAVLDFSQKCAVKTGDELQTLGENVNALGDELETALDILRQQNEQLERDIIAQRQFISNASHELRTPLSLIKGYADEMNVGYLSDAAQKDLYIEIIAEEASKMNRLLKEMLELSRMESGRIALQSERLSVGERIQTFLEKYDGYIVENGLHISLDFEDGAVGIFDAMYFEQLLANYISNAARYGDTNKQVRISTKTAGESIRVSVFNTGVQIGEDILENIWDRFYKADDARTPGSDSYGLGLSIVKAIQTVAGQGFGVENVPGGVVFWFDVKKDTGEQGN
ncbi:MAG: HAMP domain-containing sensor histidine kinase, partial [Eubacteriales bacterium]|nr:HAMP domain-containing sensor histidine kinase [Eubacteriales bacterium]